MKARNIFAAMAMMMAFGMSNASAEVRGDRAAGKGGFHIEVSAGNAHNKGHEGSHYDAHHNGHNDRYMNVCHDRNCRICRNRHHNHFVCHRHKHGMVRGCRDCARMMREAKSHHCFCLR